MFDDIPVLRALIDTSVRGLQGRDYTATQIESALATAYGVDSQLIADGTYFVVEGEGKRSSLDGQGTSEVRKLIVGCGGWSKRKTLYAGDRGTAREDRLLDPRADAAKTRAFVCIRIGCGAGSGA